MSLITSNAYYLRLNPAAYLSVQKKLHNFSYKHLKENSRDPGDELVLGSLVLARRSTLGNM